uniref:Uncharacterized protein n=1 Tax=virus sp. ctmTa7 TaxID=2828255 RepID=A0A8S5RCU0_9VIRU|nr:MAG TPA: hypothetical protein [virus sp. ctmTa7]
MAIIKAKYGGYGHKTVNRKINQSYSQQFGH